MLALLPQNNAVPLAIYLLGQPQQEASELDAAKPALCATLQRLAARDSGAAAALPAAVRMQKQPSGRVLTLLHTLLTPHCAHPRSPCVLQTWRPLSPSAAASRCLWGS